MKRGPGFLELYLVVEWRRQMWFKDSGKATYKETPPLHRESLPNEGPGGSCALLLLASLSFSTVLSPCSWHLPLSSLPLQVTPLVIGGMKCEILIRKWQDANEWKFREERQLMFKKIIIMMNVLLREISLCCSVWAMAAWGSWVQCGFRDFHWCCKKKT